MKAVNFEGVYFLNNLRNNKIVTLASLVFMRTAKYFNLNKIDLTWNDPHSL